MQERIIKTEDFTRVKNDVNGNPRYVLHFLKLNSDAELNAAPWIDISQKYALALAKSRKQGGRKFHNKQYGGGVVFQTYDLRGLCEELNAIRNN